MDTRLSITGTQGYKFDLVTDNKSLEISAVSLNKLNGLFHLKLESNAITTICNQNSQPIFTEFSSISPLLCELFEDKLVDSSYKIVELPESIIIYVELKEKTKRGTTIDHFSIELKLESQLQQTTKSTNFPKKFHLFTQAGTISQLFLEAGRYYFLYRSKSTAEPPRMVTILDPPNACFAIFADPTRSAFNLNLPTSCL